MKTIALSLIIASTAFIFGCNQETSAPKIETIEETEDMNGPTPLEMGQTIATKTQGILGKNLMQAIAENGVERAVSFCSTKAISLTDSMAVDLNASVKRVSDKHRNPNNTANEAELKYIKSAKEVLIAGNTPEPTLRTHDEKYIGYYPIVTNQMCMKCHGDPNSEIAPATLSKLNTLYPNDMATGYKPNELRGIWVVEMNKK